MAENRATNVVVLPRRRRRASVVALLRLPKRVEQRHSNAVPPEPTISDYELHAFVDGALDQMRRERVMAFLVRHPAAAADVAAYRRQNRILRELRRQRVWKSPAVGYLATQFVYRLAVARRGRMLVWGAGTAALVVVAWSVADGNWASVPHALLAAGR